VRGEYAGRYDDIYNKMRVGLQSGALPHLVVAYQNQAWDYYQAGGIVDLQPYMASPKWGLTQAAAEDFVAAFLAQDRMAGMQLGLPTNRSMEVIYYNRDWLRELGYQALPKTWAEFGEVCRKAAQQPFSRSADRRRSLGFMIDIDASRIASMVFSRGGDLVTADGSTYTLNTSQMREALAFITALIRDRAAEQVTEEGGDQREFSVGQVLFVLRSSSGLPFFATAVKSGVNFDWDVGAPPHDTAQPVVNVYGASISLCRATPATQLAAWLFLKWFTEPEQQAQWVRSSFYFPVRKSAVNGLADACAANPRYRSAFDLLDFGKAEPSVGGYQQVRMLMQQTLVNVLAGADLDQELERLQQKADHSRTGG
jgi:multiple sugar transport system substrate-binding protein/sn-glycerol 3-phosphate transport system substrate-binding protein